MYDRNAVKIYTDGSARPKNPGKGGIGMVVEFPEEMELENFEISEGYIQSTNNRMELLACIRALQWIRSVMATKKFTRIIIITDSEYVYNCHKNAQYWKDNDWRDTNGKPYENEDLWDAFLKERHKVKTRVEFAWEKGKTRAVLLRVDDLAKKGAGNPIKTDYGFRSGKFTSPRTASKKAATLYPANGEELLIRVYRKNVYGKSNAEIYKITFDVYDSLSGQYIQKCVAYQGADCITLKRNNCYKVKLDKNPKFPKILEAVPIDYLVNKKL